ncbi:MAG TPA: biotin--[acetyl-CoA-carboxylase] ligase, partial [Desulfurivibrionaceae bacterium]|nr:biotin--[acetyl-CoA-carboxylase] ligase [Desulfurivibrionaceae bacterium]
MISDPAWEAMVASERLGDRLVSFLAVAASTNDEALALARGGAPSGTMVVAERQSRGRGRLGREWLSPPGVGLYCSLVLRPRLDPADLPKLTLGAGLAASRAVEAVTGLRPLLKWPNDLWLDEKKVGGILAEARFDQASPVVVLGVGLNVNTGEDLFPPELRGKVTSLLIHAGREFARSSLLAALWDEVLAMAARLEREGFAGILADWRERDATSGRELEWLSQSGQVVRGLSLGPDAEGLLRIRDGAGRVHEVLSGD